MGTPWAIRRMLAGVKIVTTYDHAAGGKLSERAVSSAGEGAPNTILLDGVRTRVEDGRPRRHCAVERPEAGVAGRDDAAGRRGSHRRRAARARRWRRAERTIELRWRARPIKLHRSCARPRAHRQRWAGAGSSPPAGDSVTVEVVAAAAAAALARRSPLRRRRTTARFVLVESTSWAEAGHEAAEQFTVPPPPPPREAIATKPEPPPLAVEESADASSCAAARAARPASRSGKASGAIDEWIVGGRRLVLGGSARPALWRSTDNDKGAMNSCRARQGRARGVAHGVVLWIGFWLMWNGLI